jgi:transposase
MASGVQSPGLRDRGLAAEVTALREENAKLRAENAELRQLLDDALARIVELEKTVATLTARLRQNSTNSHKSPSSDKPQARKARRKSKKAGDENGSGKKRGGQPGHEGTTRELAPPEEVDETIDCRPETCECCGDKLPKPTSEPKRLQVVDLLQVMTWLKEFRQHAIECPGCGTINKGELPDEATTSAFGPGIHALVAYLVGANRVTRRNVQSILSDVFGIDVSLGALSKMEERVSEALEEPVEEAKTSVLLAPSVNIDETPFFEKNEKAWLWAAVTNSVVAYLVRATRGMKVARELLGETFRGILGSDRAKCYLLIDMKHRQICWAHLKREFQKLVDAGLPGAEIGKFLEEDRKKLFEWWHRVRDGTMARSSFRKKVSNLRQGVRALLEQHPLYEVDDPVCASFLRELLKYEDALWTFTRVEGVEPTNNAGEQAVRPGVIWRKISFGSQSERGSRFVERMLTTVGTLRKQKRRVLAFITAAYEARLSGKPSPSLLRA